MGADRRVNIIDRWGAQFLEDITLERFAACFDELDPADAEHCVVDIGDDQDRFLEFSLTSVSLGNAETGDEVGELPLPDRDTAIAIAAEFLDGDFEALHRRPWA